MLPIIILLSVLIFAYASVNFIFRKLQSRVYIPTGIEYIFLGVIISPAFANWVHWAFGWDYPKIFSGDLLNQLNLGVTLVIGLTGFIYGLNFKITEMRRVSKEGYRLAFSEILLSFITAGTISFLLFLLLYHDWKNLYGYISASFMLSLAVAISSGFIIKSLMDKYHINEQFARLIKESSFINVNFILLLYGFVFAVPYLRGNLFLNFSSFEWIVIGAILICLIGFLFFVFLGKDFDDKKIFIAVVGIIIFTSGIAYSMNFSPLYLNFILGLIIANTSKISNQIRESLNKLKHPLSVLIIIFAGYFWMPASVIAFIVSAILFIVLRYLIKIFSGKMAYVFAFNKSKIDSGIGKGLLPIEIILAAMVIEYSNVFKGEIASIVMSAVFCGMIFYGISGYNFVKKYLVDVGELKEEKL
jgi:Kef-type K+ transport system membrane component KefB